MIDAAGLVATRQAQVRKTLAQVLEPGTMQLTASANRRLWSMFDMKRVGQQWKVLDPVFWPFVGIVGWSPQHRETLQLAVWDMVHLPWQVDESWRQILASTAAVRGKRRQRVA